MESILKATQERGQKTLNLLFICSGNICRSPMAEILFEKMLQRDPLPFFDEVVIKSGAIVYSWTGKMDDYAEEVLRKYYKIPQDRLNRFQSCHLNRDRKRFEEADLIITMETYHVRQMPEDFRSKTFTLCKLAIGTDCDVDDPYGGNLATYKATAEEIYDYLLLFLKRLRKITTQ
ncbi:MAG: arsenate reductase/protein-tyrosine-phosphatase family protein [Candidatus Helarchaeota archaeon]